MSQFVEAALELPVTPQADWLETVNARGREHWKTRPFPTRKTENWKYTNLLALQEGDYLRQPAAPQSVDVGDLADIPGLAAYRLVFVNGFFNRELSSGDLPEGVELVHFRDAQGAEVERIRGLLSSLVDSGVHPFAALNEALLEDGVFVRIRANTRVSRPLQISHVCTAQAQPFTVQQRLLVQVETGAEATLVEHYTSTTEQQNSFSNGITEIQLQDNAKLTHYRMHLEEEHALHIGGLHIELGRDAVLESFQLAMGSNLQRIDAVVHHRGSGAHCGLNGVYLPRNRQLVDFHTAIEHEVPHCTTDEIFRGIVGDRARAVFNGRIHIHPGAQKTRAELSNRNLLTSRQAEVDTKPELEIYADDVQCAHGATVAQLDEKPLYYMRTRGISRQEAEVILSFSFINELLMALRDEPIRELLRPYLARRFARDEKLLRHIA